MNINSGYSWQQSNLQPGPLNQPAGSSNDPVQRNFHAAGNTPYSTQHGNPSVPLQNQNNAQPSFSAGQFVPSMNASEGNLQNQPSIPSFGGQPRYLQNNPSQQHSHLSSQGIYQNPPLYSQVPSNQQFDQSSYTSIPRPPSIPSLPQQANQPYSNLGQNESLSNQMGSMSFSSSSKPSIPAYPTNRPTYDSVSSPAPSYDPNNVNLSTSGKIPSDQIPCPIIVRNADQETFSSLGTYRTSLDISPPLSTTNVAIVDDGNCNPLFMRLTTFKIAQTSEIQSQSGVPLGIILQPFGSVPYEIPTIDCSNGTGIERCKNCMAYINPFVIFSSGGRKYKCNICMTENDLKGDSVIDQSYAGSYSTQQVVYRPELKFGTVEFVVPPEYVQRPKSQTAPFLLFAIDVTKPTLLPFIIAAIKRCVNFLTEGRIYKYVSVMAFERDAHFFNFSNPDNPSLVTASDLEANYSPVHFNQCMIDVTQGIDVLINAIENLPLYFKNCSRNDSSLSSSLKFMLNVLEERNGKIVLFNASHFGTGPNCLALRDDLSPSAEKEKSLLTGISSDLSDIAIRAAQNGIAIDFFAISNGNFLDLASVSPLSSLSGGDLYYYQSYQLVKSDSLNDDLLKCISQVKAFDCYCKLRISNGVSIMDNYGSIYMRTASEILFGNVSETKNFACMLQIDEKIPDKGKVYFQFAALYTDDLGVRKVRVHNLCASVATNMYDLFGHADAEAVTNFICKRAISLVTSDALSVIRDLLAVRISYILAGYRKYCSPNTSVTQLVLPESLKLIPIYLLSLMKTKAFNAFTLKTDLRIFWIRLLNNLSIQQMALICYPKLFCITNNSITVELIDSKEHLPTPLPLSLDQIDSRHIYVISNGFLIIVYIGNAVDPQILQEVFAVSSQQSVDPIALTAGLPILNTPHSICIRRFVQYFQEPSPFNVRSPSLFVVRQGLDSLESEFQSMLVHEQSSGIPAYVDYLCSLHSSVKTQIKK